MPFGEYLREPLPSKEKQGPPFPYDTATGTLAPRLIKLTSRQEIGPRLVAAKALRMAAASNRLGAEEAADLTLLTEAAVAEEDSTLSTEVGVVVLTRPKEVEVADSILRKTVEEAEAGMTLPEEAEAAGDMTPLRAQALQEILGETEEEDLSINGEGSRDSRSKEKIPLGYGGTCVKSPNGCSLKINKPKQP